MVREVRFYMPGTQRGGHDLDDTPDALGATAPDVAARLPDRWTDWLEDEEHDDSSIS